MSGECAHTNLVFCGYYLATLQRRWQYVCQDCHETGFYAGPEGWSFTRQGEWVPGGFDRARFLKLMLEIDPTYRPIWAGL